MLGLDRQLYYSPEIFLELISSGFPHLRTCRYLSYRAGLVLRDVSFYLADMLYYLDHFLLLISLLLMRGPNNFLLPSPLRHFLFFRAMTDIACLPLLLIAHLPKPKAS